jgi:hypothetical protein
VHAGGRIDIHCDSRVELACHELVTHCLSCLNQRFRVSASDEESGHIYITSADGSTWIVPPGSLSQLLSSGRLIIIAMPIEKSEEVGRGGGAAGGGKERIQVDLGVERAVDVAEGEEGITSSPILPSLWRFGLEESEGQIQDKGNGKQHLQDDGEVGAAVGGGEGGGKGGEAGVQEEAQDVASGEGVEEGGEGAGRGKGGEEGKVGEGEAGEGGGGAASDAYERVEFISSAPGGEGEEGGEEDGSQTSGSKRGKEALE